MCACFKKVIAICDCCYITKMFSCVQRALKILKNFRWFIYFLRRYLFPTGTKISSCCGDAVYKATVNIIMYLDWGEAQRRNSGSLLLETSNLMGVMLYCCDASLSMSICAEILCHDHMEMHEHVRHWGMMGECISMHFHAFPERAVYII